MGGPVGFSCPVAPTAGEYQAGEGRECREEGVTHSPETKQMHKNVSMSKDGGKIIQHKTQKVYFSCPSTPRGKLFVAKYFPFHSPIIFFPFVFSLMVESFNTTYNEGSGSSGAILGCHGNEACLSKLGHFSCCLFYARLSLISFSLTLP